MRREERRAQVLQVAREVFAELGYHRASISDIIDRAGVARGTFYLYFEGKRAIFEELVDDLFARIRANIHRVDTAGGPLRMMNELHANLDAIVAVLTGNLDLTRILLHEAVGLDEGFDEKLRSFYAEVHTLVSESLELGQEMGFIRALDTRLASRFLLGSMKELLFDLTLSGGAALEDAHKATDELLDFYARGIVEPAVLAAL